MKAGIKNNSFKPLPISPLMGAAAISGGASIGGGIVGAITSAIEGKKQRQHDKEMAALNQKYVLEQMEQQNTYQVEQWNRENDFNDPTAVRQRYEAAGISPHAAMGSGAANGAGIAGGLSSAPSGSGTGHSSSLPSAANAVANSIAGAGTDIAQLIETKRMNDAEIANTNAQTTAQLIDNLTKGEQNLLNLENTKSQIIANLAKADLSESEREVNKKRLEQIDASIESTKESINLIKKQIETEDARAKNIQSETKYTDEKSRQVKFENDWSDAMRGTPISLLKTESGLITFLSKFIADGTVSGVQNMWSALKQLQTGKTPDGQPLPDPVKEFVVKNYNKLADWLNKIDKMATKGKVKTLPKFGD